MASKTYLSRQGAVVEFWSRVKDGAACWEWQGRRTRKGYGQMTSRWFSTQSVHRIAWELAYGPIPDGLFVLHRCDNPPCVRPGHLFLGTNSDNMRDMVAKGRSSRVGSRNPKAHLTEGQVIEIRAAVAAGQGPNVLAPAYGVSRQAITEIVKRRTWRHLS